MESRDSLEDDHCRVISYHSAFVPFVINCLLAIFGERPFRPHSMSVPGGLLDVDPRIHVLIFEVIQKWLERLRLENISCTSSPLLMHPHMK